MIRSFIVIALSSLSITAAADDKAAAARTITMEVTDEGFLPKDVKLKKGEPVSLVITRKTEKTCATEIVIDEHKINTKLPLNTPVTVSFTPKKTGQLKYGCAMKKMIGGVLTIE